MASTGGSGPNPPNNPAGPGARLQPNRALVARHRARSRALHGAAQTGISVRKYWTRKDGVQQLSAQVKGSLPAPVGFNSRPK